MIKNIYIVLNRNFLIFKKSPFSNFVLISIEPLLYLIAFGGGFGSLIKTINGMSYLDYYYPGRLCNTAIVLSFFEGTYPTLSKISFQNTYLSMLLGGLRSKEIVIGEILWCSIKGFMAVLSTIAISAVFGIGSWWVILTLPVIFVLCMIFSAIAIFLSSKVKKYSSFSYYSTILILPISLFSGTFFPIENLPKYIQYFSNILPTTYAIKLCRSIMYGHSWGEEQVLATVVLACYLITALVVCYIFFKRRLEEI